MHYERPLVLLSPEQRVMRAKLGAYALHATHDPRETTKPGREAFLNSFERQVDPDGVLSPEERHRRAASARKAHFYRLALKSAQKRSKGQRKATVAETVAIAEIGGSRDITTPTSS